MDKATKDLFAEMFGGQKSEAAPAAETPAAEPVVEKDDDADGMHERPDIEAERIETEEKCEADADEGCDPKALANAKKELGIGGAAFCDELFAQCPEVFQKLKDAKKTLSGFFNFAYSYALDEYVRKNGRTNGGGYWNLAVLSEKYLDPSVKEGFTVGEPKVKKPTPPAPKATNAAKTVKKVAKLAAKAAKKEAKKEAEKKTEVKKPEVRIDFDEKSNPFSGVDLSSIFK